MAPHYAGAIGMDIRRPALRPTVAGRILVIMKELVCNYAIARFLPYRETGEFVNIGVVLTCPQVGYSDFLFEKRKYKRVTDFFPELDVEIFKSGLQAFLLELERLKAAE